MGQWVIAENLGLRIESTLREVARRDRIGVESGAEVLRLPEPDCQKSHIYSNISPIHPSPRRYREYISCESYAYLAFSVSLAALRESGREAGSANAYGLSGEAGVSIHWTRPEKLFKRRLDGSDSKTYFPVSLGVGPLGQYSSLQGWGAGVAGSVQVSGFFYINAGLMMNQDRQLSEYLGIGVRNFL